MLEWLIPIIVDNVFGYILDQSGFGEQIRSKFESKPIKVAFQRSLQKTFTHFEERYPQLAAEDLFRESFRDQVCTSILAQLLLRDGQHYPDALANDWANVLYKDDPKRHAVAIGKFQPIAVDFLNYLNSTLRTEDALQEIFDSQALERAASGIAVLTNDVHSLVNHFVPPQFSENDLQDQCLQYCQKLHDQWKMLDFKGIQHADVNRPMSIPLTEVFVLPDVLVGVPENETLERDEAQKNNVLKKQRQKDSRLDEQKKSARGDRQPLREKQIVAQREDLRTVLAKHQRLIILGDPGSGKSTLLRYLMLTLVENSGRFRSEFPQFAPEVNSMIPLYIPLSSYAESWLSHDVEERSLKDFLPKQLRYMYLDSYTKAALWQLEQGKLLVLLDGLDEIPDASLRMQIVRQIEIFTQSYPHNRFIVTSRIVGYKDAPLAAEYQAYTLEDFNEEQIKNFTKKWCPAYERWVNQVEDSQSLQYAATKEAEKLFLATRLNEGVRRLAVNPLLLTILALIQRQGIELPSHRVELYDLCVTTLLETWIKAKGPVGATQFSKNEIIKILRPLAFWMHEHPAVGAIPEEELLEQIVRQLLERRIARFEEEAQRHAEQFLQAVRGKTGILIERGKHRYGFLHLTFEEYFAALELVIRKKDREDFIKLQLHNPRWRVVILLAVGIVGILQTDEVGVTELVEEAILKANSPFERWLHRDLLFSGLCLADDVGLSIACEDAIIEQAIYIYLTSPYNSIRSSFSTMFGVWKGTAIAKKIINFILDLMNQDENLTNVTYSTSAVSTELSSTFQFEREFRAYHQRHIQQNKDSSIRLLQLNVIIALNHLVDMTDKISYVIDSLSDPDSGVRQAAVTALGQVAGDQPQVIAMLLNVLSDPDSDVRQAGVTALGQVAGDQPQVVEALLNVLSNPDSGVRQAAVTALKQVAGDQPQVVEALLKILFDSDWAVRQAAVTALGQVAGDQPQVVEALLNVLSDPDSDVQQAAVTALKQVAGDQPQVVAMLLKALSDPDSDVRQAAVTALEQVAGDQPQVIEALLKALSDPDWFVRQAAVTVLGQVTGDQPQVVEALLKILSNPDWFVRQTAVTALGQVTGDQPQVVEALLKILSNPDWIMRQTAVTILGLVAGDQPQVVAMLLKALSDPDSDVRQAAVTALGQVTGDQPQVVEALLKALSNPGSDVRQAAVTALGQVTGDQPQVVEALLKALSDPDSGVRQAAVTVLGQVAGDQPQVIEALLNVLSNPDWAVRQAAVTALGQVAGDQPQVIAMLLKALSDPGSSVRQAAVTALKQVAGDQPQVIAMLLKALSDPGSSVRQAAVTALKQVAGDQPQVIEQLLTILSEISTASLLQKGRINERNQSFRKGLFTRMILLIGQIGEDQPQVIAMLLKALSDPDSGVRQAAVTALGQVAGDQPQVVAMLLKILSDPDSGVRQAAVTALGQVAGDQPQVIEALLKALSDSDWFVRQRAVTALGQVTGDQPQVVEALLKILFDSDWFVQQRAVTILGQVAGDQSQVIAMLLKALSDPGSGVRQAIVTALEQVAGDQPQVVAMLLNVPSNSGSDVRQRAVTALGQVTGDQPQVVEALLKALSNPDWAVRQTAVTILGQVAGDQPQVVEALLKALSNPDWAVRQRAVTALGQVAGDQPQVVEALLNVLSDPDSDVRQAAVTALKQVAGDQPQVIEALLNVLSDPDSGVRQAAVTALKQVAGDQPQVVAMLLKALSDPGSSVRQAAVTALKQVAGDQPQGIAMLLNVLSDPDSGVRQAAVTALKQVAGDQPQVVEALLKVLSDPDSGVRQAAVTALGQVAGDQPQVVEALLNVLSDPDSGVRQAAVTALGQVAGDQPQVVEALLNVLSDPDSSVRQATTAALGILPINSQMISPRTEEILMKYSLLASKQFTADQLVDSLFSSLYKIVGEA